MVNLTLIKLYNLVSLLVKLLSQMALGLPKTIIILGKLEYIKRSVGYKLTWENLKHLCKDHQITEFCS